MNSIESKEDTWLRDAIKSFVVRVLFVLASLILVESLWLIFYFDNVWVLEIPFKSMIFATLLDSIFRYKLVISFFAVLAYKFLSERASIDLFSFSLICGINLVMLFGVIVFAVQLIRIVDSIVIGISTIVEKKEMLQMYLLISDFISKDTTSVMPLLITSLSLLTFSSSLVNNDYGAMKEEIKEILNNKS